MKKLFIVFEGIDGSGKSTQAKMLFSLLKEKYKDAVFFKFPTHQSTEFGKIIDEYLSGKMGSLSEVPPEIPSLLYALDRYQFKKELESANCIVCDRYWQSNLAHQAAKLRGRARKEFIDWLICLDKRLPVPTHVFLLDIPVELAYQRIAREKKLDIHESDRAYMENVRAVYLMLAKRYKWHVINALDGKREKSVEEIASEILKVLNLG
uniref:Thymidylate kinase n=1 Tax=candidate division WOR-3 bacterium TaxID=2052148 RepID=A0A7V3KNE6_UNCW3